MLTVGHNQDGPVSYRDVIDMARCNAEFAIDTCSEDLHLPNPRRAYLENVIDTCREWQVTKSSVIVDAIEAYNDVIARRG